MGWDPELYERFASERMRPFLDLLARVQGQPATVIDAGCGTGRTTHELRRRYPRAAIVGVDASAEMRPDVVCDLREFSPDPVDLVVCNAVLHWIPDPEAMLRHLAGWVRPGGQLAIQVPANHDAPSHRLAREVAAQMGLEVAWGDHVLAPDAYRRVLAPWPTEIWDDVYVHDVDVLAWLAGTTLRPVREAAPEQFAEYERRLRPLLAEAVPGAYRFRRRFIMARNDTRTDPTPGP